MASFGFAPPSQPGWLVWDVRVQNGDEEVRLKRHRPPCHGPLPSGCGRWLRGMARCGCGARCSSGSGSGRAVSSEAPQAASAEELRGLPPRYSSPEPRLSGSGCGCGGTVGRSAKLRSGCGSGPVIMCKAASAARPALCAVWLREKNERTAAVGLRGADHGAEGPNQGVGTPPPGGRCIWNHPHPRPLPITRPPLALLVEISHLRPSPVTRPSRLHSPSPPSPQNLPPTPDRLQGV